MSEDNVLSRYLSAITEYEKPQRILLFGSRARGQARIESDYDLCVIYNKMPKRNLEVLQDLYRKLFSVEGSPVDIVVYEADAFDKKALYKGSFESRIRAEAKVVYG